MVVAGPPPPGSLKTADRAGDNDIVIPDVGLRHHATLILTPAGPEISDNRSINGTFVNGSQVDTALLLDRRRGHHRQRRLVSPAERWFATETAAAHRRSGLVCTA